MSDQFAVAFDEAAAEAVHWSRPSTVEPGPIVVEISGATEGEVRTALGALPTSATYQLQAR